MDFSKEVAKSLIAIGAVGFRPDDPVLFKSGILAPVYVDNRKFPFFPGAWKLVIEGFKKCIETEVIQFDVIAGIEAAGIPHSSALGFFMQQPSVFVRKEVKDHGTKKRVEGGEVQGKKVLLVEDLVTMGTSSLSGVHALPRRFGEIGVKGALHHRRHREVVAPGVRLRAPHEAVVEPERRVPVSHMSGCYHLDIHMSTCASRDVNRQVYMYCVTCNDPLAYMHGKAHPTLPSRAPRRPRSHLCRPARACS